MNTIILEGGLGNRMRVAAAAYTMAQCLADASTPIPFRVLWTSQWGMRCRFDELFQSLTPDIGLGEEAFTLRDAHGFERLLFARPTARNLHLPRLLQRIGYRHIILSPRIYFLQRDGFDFEAWFRQDNTLMTAYRDFCPWDDSLIPLLFRPLPAIQAEADARASDFTPHTIGLHIRRTDNQQSIDASPVELFFDTVDRELATHPDLHVYLATDDEPTKVLFRQRYGSERIQTAPSQATRDSVSGIREALLEMLLLARTSHVYGSAGSTFSEMAVKFTAIPLTILSR